MAVLREGAQGGIDLLDKEDRKTDSEIAEKQEPLNLRNPDLLDGVLSNALGGKSAGGYSTNEMFEKLTENGMRVQEEYEFDRFYWQQGLLVDFFSASLNDTIKEETNREIERKRAFLKSGSEQLKARIAKYGCTKIKYLPIIGGLVDPPELRALLVS